MSESSISTFSNTHFFDSLPTARRRRGMAAKGSSMAAVHSKAWYLQQGGEVSPDVVQEGGGWLARPAIHMVASPTANQKPLFPLPIARPAITLSHLSQSYGILLRKRCAENSLRER